MDVPQDLHYSSTHQWVRMAGELAIVGITDFAQDELGEIVYVDLPARGAALRQGATMGEIESIKTVSELVSPVTGTVEETNSAILDKPGLVNSDPYGEGWLVRVRLSDDSAPEPLLSPAEYAERTESGG